jgi:hypothetical protein
VDAFLAAYDINHKVVPMQELIASAKGWLFPKVSWLNPAGFLLEI